MPVRYDKNGDTIWVSVTIRGCTFMRDYSNSSHLLLKLPFYLVEGLTLKNGYFISALVFLERFNQSLLRQFNERF